VVIAAVVAGSRSFEWRPNVSNAHLAISCVGRAGLGFIMLLNTWGVVVARAEAADRGGLCISAEQGAPMPPEAGPLMRWTT